MSQSYSVLTKNTVIYNEVGSCKVGNGEKVPEFEYSGKTPWVRKLVYLVHILPIAL